MLTLELAVGAVGCLVAGWVTLRLVGPGYRIGRLLSATPAVTVDEAVDLAGSPGVHYVRTTGRISSTEEFPDEHDRPLVYRHKRIEIQEAPERWRTVTDEREAVPFGIETRSAFIGVDIDALAEGLVAVPREAMGRAADLPASLGEQLNGVAAGTPARLIIEQLSAVEHATVCGRPALIDGRPTLTSGAGRPLIVTGLEPAAAMRILAGDQRRRVLLAAALLAVGGGLLVSALIAFIAGL